MAITFSITVFTLFFSVDGVKNMLTVSLLLRGKIASPQ